MSSNLINSSAGQILETSLDELRATVEGLPVEALNWRPAQADTNSLAVLAVHTLTSTRMWLSVAVGAPLPDRDRDAEFRSTATDATELLRWIDRMTAECRAIVKDANDLDATAMRRTPSRLNPGDPEQVPAIWALLHATTHMREHIGQMSLTRQLLEERG